MKVPCLGQWPVHIPDTGNNLVLFGCYTFQDKELHACAHTLLSNILTVPIPPVPYSLSDDIMQVLVLHMTCQAYFGSKLSASLSAATYSSSRFSCAMF